MVRQLCEFFTIKSRKLTPVDDCVDTDTDTEGIQTHTRDMAYWYQLIQRLGNASYKECTMMLSDVLLSSTNNTDDDSTDLAANT